ncbi:MAG TPA: hypothetical protein VE172_20455 [Stackebrandtia sp.]|jgi:hypothetical protein|uniref:hypothetical protein n=1 Tax=Stackebrandtia sp. TaxID=2023065 RepID=UPI002D48766D|nr:hypothetical protein [Stackebrandtia sp.]HZE41178.1 hypothetical protein [Stackebrandtia sp.]
MESWGDMMRRLDLKVTSPDKRIRGRVHQGMADIKFIDNAYREYTEAAMGSQIAALCQLLWVGYRKADVLATTQTAGAAAAEEMRHPAGFADRELFAARRAMEMGATSDSGRLAISCVGFQNWRFTIQRGTFDALSENEFRADFRSVVRPLMDDYHEKLDALLDAHRRRFDPEGYQSIKDRERFEKRQEAAARPHT